MIAMAFDAIPTAALFGEVLFSKIELFMYKFPLYVSTALEAVDVLFEKIEFSMLTVPVWFPITPWPDVLVLFAKVEFLIFNAPATLKIMFPLFVLFSNVLP